MREENENEEIDINKIYDLNTFPDQDNKVSDYDFTFEIISNISSQLQDINDRDRTLTIIKKIIENIINYPNEEKYRKLKLSNKNIQAIFEIDGIYEFFTNIGFQEKFIENDLYFFLPNYDLEVFNIILSYVELLLVNDNDNNNIFIDKLNVDLPDYDQVVNSDRINSKKSEEKKSLIDILKETKENRVNPSAYNSTNTEWRNVNNYSSNKNVIKSILKNTADIRKHYNSEYVPTNYNFPSSNQSNISNNKKFMTLDDIQFNNPDSSKVNNSNFKVNDEIGKKCLELTNKFRKQNGHHPLQWDDNVWKISYGHSQNMGNYKVKFGHDGFNERIKKLPFYFSLACENVFMCHGLSEYSLAEAAVNGWINSPGHRKNLLANTSHCAIAVFRNSSGAYYLTQIFVRK